MSLGTSLLAILAQDTGGALTTGLQNFKTAIDGTSDIQEVVAAGTQFEVGLVTALPGVESSLIKDTTNLLVTDAVAEITKLQQAATATPATSAAPVSPTAAS